MSVELLQAASDEVQALFDSCLVDQTTDVATLPEAERLTLTLFPNPSTDRLTLDVPTNTCLERAEVFNLSMVHQRVHVESFSKGLGSQTMDVSRFAQWRLPNGRALLGPHACREVHGRAVIQIFMSEYGILKWSLVVAPPALLAIFTKAPRVMEGDGGPSLLEQRDPYGYGGRFAGQPVDVWLTIEATNRKTGEAISHVDSIRVSPEGCGGNGCNEGKEVRSSRDVAVFVSDSAYLPIDSGRLQMFFVPAAKIGYPLWVNAYSNGYHMSEHWLTPTMHESEREEDGNSLFVKAKMKFGPVDTKWLVMPIDRLTGEDLFEVGGLSAVQRR